jgi:fimbrial isopeptide formation D2 family protein
MMTTLMAFIIEIQAVTSEEWDLSEHDTETMEISDGWSNGGNFDCIWLKSNVRFNDGIMSLSINKYEGSDYNYSGAEYRTIDYYGYGLYEVRMKPIKQEGVVSSFFMYTAHWDDNPWDEIDIEFVGKDTTSVLFNYCVNGDWTYNGNGGNGYTHQLGFDASEEFHIYAFDWQQDYIAWLVDGVEVYRTPVGAPMPNSPGRIMANVWPGIGVDEWLGIYDGTTPLQADYDWIRFTPSDKQSSKGNLTIHQYYKDAEANISSITTGKKLLTSQLPTDSKLTSGVAFDIYKIDGINNDGNPPFTLNDSTSYIIKEGKVIINDGNIHSYDVTYVGQQLTDEKGKVSWRNLDRGYYVVVQNVSESTMPVECASTAPFVVAVPMLDKTNEGASITDIYTYIESIPMSNQLLANHLSVSIGGPLQYSLLTTVPADIAGAKEYEVINTVDSAFSVNQNMIVVYEVSDDGTNGNIIDNTNYTIDIGMENDVKTISLSFNEVGYKSLHGKTKIRIEMSGFVNDALLMKEDYTLRNAFLVSYIDSSNYQSSFQSNEVSTITGQLELVDKDQSNQSLGGSKFYVADSLENAKNGKFLKKDANGAILNPTHINYDSAEEWFSVSDNDTGVVLFQGLQVTDDSGNYLSYWMVQTEIDNEYELHQTPIMISFDEMAIEEEQYKTSTHLINTKKYVLPNTGSNSRLLSTIIGVILCGLGCITTTLKID